MLRSRIRASHTGGSHAGASRVRAPRIRAHAAAAGVFAAVLSLGFALVFVQGVAAQGPITLTTPYPSVVVEPGASLTFPIRVVSRQPQIVQLEVQGAAQGWRAELRGGGFTVDGVYAQPTEPPELELSVRVPPDVAPGEYPLTVRATAGNASATLPLTIRIAEEVGGSVTLEPEFRALQGTTEDTFTFSVTLRNDTPRNTTFDLVGQGPEGWQVTARPSGQTQATSVEVEAGGTATVNLTADPGPNVTAGDYPLRLTAAGGGQTVQVDLGVRVTGTYEMTFTTPDERLTAQANPGTTRRVDLVIVNAGSAPLENLTLSGTPPEGWEVTFEPETVPGVQPRDQQRVAANITPANDAVAGDYVVTLSASNEQVDQDVQLRVTVETPVNLALVGLAVIVVAIAGLWWVFRTFGRR